MELDRLHIAILEYPPAHGRATTTELSDAVALSPSPIHRRQKMLEEAGIIQRYVTLLNQERVGLPVNAFVTVKLATHTGDALGRAIAACSEVMAMYEVTGARDYLMRIPGVQSVETAMALQRVVYRTNLPLRARGKT